jgi:hypothetical protein
MQCEAGSSPQCSYFYVYLSDWDTADTSPACAGGKYVVSRTDFGNALNPAVASEADCLETFLGAEGSEGDLHGRFDPVTGVVDFQNIALRLFSPVVPVFGFQAIDAVLQTSLTTECLTAARIPDSEALGNRLVPERVSGDTPPLCGPGFDRRLMGLEGQNPVALYTGGSCADPNELHGRRMGAADTSGTFDPPLSDESLTFDLAGVARIVSSSANATGKMMYIVIKAEIE